MTTSKLDKAAVKSEVDLTTALAQLIAALSLAGTNITINVNTPPATVDTAVAPNITPATAASAAPTDPTPAEHVEADIMYMPSCQGCICSVCSRRVAFSRTPNATHQCGCSICGRDDLCVKWNEAGGNGDSGVDEVDVGPAEDNGVRWYAVTIGKRVGVFNHWTIVSPLVTSVSGACSSRHPSRAAAEVAFARALATHLVRLVE